MYQITQCGLNLVEGNLYQDQCIILKKFQPTSLTIAILNTLFQYENTSKLEKIRDIYQDELADVNRLFQEIINIRKGENIHQSSEYQFRMLKNQQKQLINQLFRIQFKVDLTRQELKLEEIEKIAQFYEMNITIIKLGQTIYQTNYKYEKQCVIAKSLDGQYYQLIPIQFEQLNSNLTEQSFMEEQELMKQNEQQLEIPENNECSKCKQVFTTQQKYITQCHHTYCNNCLEQLFAVTDVSICYICQSIINYEDSFNGHYRCYTCQHYDGDECIQVKCLHYLCFNFIKQQQQNKFACPKCEILLKQSDYLSLKPIICSGCGFSTYNVKYKYKDCDHQYCMDCLKRQRFKICQLCEKQNVNKRNISCPICRNKTVYFENKDDFKCTQCYSIICLKHKKLKKLCCCFQCGSPLNEITCYNQIDMNCSKCEKMICIKCFRITQSNKYHLCQPPKIEIQIEEPKDLQNNYQCSYCQIQGDSSLLGKNNRCSLCQLSYEYSQNWNQLTKPSQKHFNLSKSSPKRSRIQKSALRLKQQQ